METPRTGHATQTQQLSEPFENLMIAALAFVASSEGPYSSADINFAVQTLTRVSPRPYTHTEIESLWQRLLVRRTAIIDYLAGLSVGLDEAQQGTIVYYCLLVVISVGQYGGQRARALEQVANAISMNPLRFRAIVHDTLQSLRAMQQQQAKSEDGQTRPQSQAGSRVFWAIVQALVIVAIVPIGMTYLLGNAQYNEGYEAYQASDCSTAIAHLQGLTEYPVIGEHSSTIISQCQPLVDAENSHVNGDVAAALSQYASITQEKFPAFLFETAQSRIKELGAIVRPESLASRSVCGKIESLREADVFPTDDETIPRLYLACGQLYDASNSYARSFSLYVVILREFPGFSRVNAVEEALLASSEACHSSEVLAEVYSVANKASPVQNIFQRIGGNTSNAPLSSEDRLAFIGRFYISCGSLYEEEQQYEEAVRVYEEFLDNFKGLPQEDEVTESLAKSLYLYAESADAAELPSPDRTGTVANGETVVIIQNDSPEDMQISFSGPDSRIERLDRCVDCQTYSSSGPTGCPEQGPYGSYTLSPGKYFVVVKSTSDESVIPWRGTWNLEAGSEYSHCFYIVTTWGR